MSYLLDKKVKRKRYIYVSLCVVAFFIIFYLRTTAWHAMSFVSHTIFRPVLMMGSNVGERLGGLGSYFLSKNSLLHENEILKLQLAENETRMSNYNSLVADDASLKEILSRKDPKIPMTLSAILSKPNVSAYDTLLIDAGTLSGVKVGDRVFALGNVPIGRIVEVFLNSSKVVLYSSAGERTQVVAGTSNIFLETVGRGGGNFEMIMPRDFVLNKGDTVVLPGINSYVLAVSETIISDPRDPFIKALLVSPVNIQSLKFVEVEKK